MSSRVVVVKESTFWVEFCATLWWTTYDKKNKTWCDQRSCSLPSSTVDIWNQLLLPHCSCESPQHTQRLRWYYTNVFGNYFRQEFASFRKGYCIPSSFQTFHLNPLPVTPPWRFAFNPSPAISLGCSSSPPAWPFAEVSSSAAEVRAWDTEARHCHTASPAWAAAGRAAHGCLMFSRHL